MTMRFMVMVKATADYEAGQLPSTEALEEMSRYNADLVKAGILLAADGLHPSSKGMRVRFDGDDGPAAALALVDALVEENTLARYHLLPAVRADLLVKLSRLDEARAEFERAAGLTDNERERELLRSRAADCVP